MTYGLSENVLRELSLVSSDQVNDAWIRDDNGRLPMARKDRVNHASKIGHPCDRHLVLRRTHGDLGAPPSPRLAAIFARGKALEQPVAVKQLTKAGYRVWDEQKTFDIVEKGRVLISCTIDCLAKPPSGTLTYVVDHKIINPHDWEKLPEGFEGYEFLKESTKPWLRSYPGQVMSYMYSHPGSAEVGLLQFINAETLLTKFVYVPFEAEYMQSLIDRAYRIDTYADAVNMEGVGALPPPIPYDAGICGRCDLIGICLPDQAWGDPLELVEDESFIALVEEDRDLSNQKLTIEKQYKTVHDRIKFMVGDRDRLAAGRFIIIQKQIETKEYVVAAKTYSRLDIREVAPKEIDVEEEETA